MVNSKKIKSFSGTSVFPDPNLMPLCCTCRSNLDASLAAEGSLAYIYFLGIQAYELNQI